MKTSDKAWMWAGYNYTDDDSSALEKLAIRFKNCDLAQRFYNTVQDVLSQVRLLQGQKQNNESVDSSSQERHEEEKTDAPKFIPSTVQNYGVENVSGDEHVVGDEAGYEYQYDEDEEDDDDDDDDR